MPIHSPIGGDPFVPSSGAWRMTVEENPMWIYSDKGNLSVSRHRDDPGSLMVRARDRDSLTALFPGVALVETPEADYRWRLTLPEADVIAALASALAAIDYDADVKNVVSWDRQALYRDIWAVTRGHQGGA